MTARYGLSLSASSSPPSSACFASSRSSAGSITCRSPGLTSTRDHHTCQYCSRVFPTAELTFDHVVPVAQGGRKDWENIVTCCVGCNRLKGGRTPAEARMKLLRHPRRPDSAPAIRITVGLRDAPERLA